MNIQTSPNATASIIQSNQVDFGPGCDQAPLGLNPCHHGLHGPWLEGDDMYGSEPRTPTEPTGQREPATPKEPAGPKFPGDDISPSHPFVFPNSPTTDPSSRDAHESQM